MTVVAHGKHVLEPTQWYLSHTAIQVINTCLDDAHYGGDSCSEGAVSAAAEKGQFITQAHFEIGGQHTAYHYFLGIHALKVTPLLNQAGKGGNQWLKAGLNTSQQHA
ncbi:MAG: hypothetical protein GY917_16650, partial [Planctomycetaceae bacterium]|nr:hypothetical protein [Planctomycetaceae bacterium]